MMGDEKIKQAEALVQEKGAMLERLMLRLRGILGEGRYVSFEGKNGSVRICL